MINKIQLGQIWFSVDASFTGKNTSINYNNEIIPAYSAEEIKGLY